ncbi:MAG TPA: 3-phosphoshikimate 1-carboxyvinyltransferase, partial [bacterium]|nr:3-phosphoshikimate 1-carboxyvinyltransferase [bacterium]
RDHTERMLRYFGGNIERKGSVITIPGNQEFTGKEVYVPGDFSSAAYFMAAAFMAEDSRLKIRDTGINPTRTGFTDVLSRMGADVKIYGQKEISGEPVGNIEINGGRRLRGTDIVPGEIPGIIDEIPLIAVVASTAEGRTSISGAGELRVKESDRLEAISSELNKMGARVNASQDGLTIDGVKRLKGCVVDSRGDHRIAMSLAIAALWAEGTTVIRNFECVKISFPSFPELLAETGCAISVK